MESLGVLKSPISFPDCAFFVCLKSNKQTNMSNDPNEQFTELRIYRLYKTSKKKSL